MLALWAVMAQAPPGPDGSRSDEHMEDGDPHTRLAKKFRSTKRSFADVVASLNISASEDSSRVDANEWAFEEPTLRRIGCMREYWWQTTGKDIKGAP